MKNFHIDWAELLSSAKVSDCNKIEIVYSREQTDTFNATVDVNLICDVYEL